MIRPRSILPALLSLALAAPASAATLHVPSEYATIQAGITAAVAGDTVEVACGTYYESGLVVLSGVVLRSATGLPECVTIDGYSVDQPGYSILSCSGDSTSVVEGFLITNGYGDFQGVPGGLLCTGSPVVRNCRLYNNWASSAPTTMVVSGQPRFYNCEFTGYGEGTPIFIGVTSYFEGCSFVDCWAGDTNSGALVGSGTFVDCYFGNNHADAGDGGAISGGTITLISCVFENNSGGPFYDPSDPYRGGAVSAGRLTAINCVFRNNSAQQGGAIQANELIAEGCTFYDNGSDLPAGSSIDADSGLISHCIIIGRSYEFEGGTVVEAGPGLVIECTNIWFPTENAWAGSIGSQLGQNGNISQDPVFCDALNGDFSLSSISPCLDALCGTMGAFGLGCFDAKPVIISINDVGNDQGRQVRLTWYRAQDDFAGSPFNGYAIYRRQDLYAAAPEAIQTSGRGAFALPGWDYVTTVPNHWDDTYQVIVPTLCDSTITSGPCWSAFFISAMTPTAFYDSPVDSGYSKDNLAPPTPTSFAVSYNTGSGNHLVWDAVAANDWAGFRVYRGTTPGFTPSPANLVHSTTQTTWDDPAFDGWDVHYRVTSFDLAGNESDPTEFTSVTDVRDNPRPLSLELGPNVPNPFNPSTTIPFTIPTAGRVTITIYDVRGAKVRTLVDREYQPGHHSAAWDGRNDAGSTVGSGVFLVRLEQLERVSARRAILLK